MDYNSDLNVVSSLTKIHDFSFEFAKSPYYFSKIFLNKYQEEGFIIINRLEKSQIIYYKFH